LKSQEFSTPGRAWVALSVIRPTIQESVVEVRVAALMKKIIEFEDTHSWTTPNALYGRGQKLYLGGNGFTPEHVTAKQAIRWFLDCRRYAKVYVLKGGVDFLLSNGLQR